MLLLMKLQRVARNAQRGGRTARKGLGMRSHAGLGQQLISCGAGGHMTAASRREINCCCFIIDPVSTIT